MQPVSQFISGGIVRESQGQWRHRKWEAALIAFYRCAMYVRGHHTVPIGSFFNNLAVMFILKMPWPVTHGHYRAYSGHHSVSDEINLLIACEWIHQVLPRNDVWINSPGTTGRVIKRIDQRPLLVKTMFGVFQPKNISRRSEERRVGKEGVSTCESGGAQIQEKK